MTFNEARNAVKKGEHAFRLDWNKGKYLHLVSPDSVSLPAYYIHEGGQEFAFNFEPEDIQATDWYIKNSGVGWSGDNNLKGNDYFENETPERSIFDEVDKGVKVADVTIDEDVKVSGGVSGGSGSGSSIEEVKPKRKYTKKVK